MKRQSMKRHENVDIWKICEKCNIYITSKEFEKHVENCENKSEISLKSYIYDNTFYTDQLDEKAPSDDIVDLSEKQINNLIFLSKLTMQTCNIQLCDFVIIEVTSSDKKPIIRRAWPTTDRFLTKIFVSKNEFEKTWEGNCDNLQFKIKKLTRDPFPASRIILSHVNPNDFDANANSDIIRIIKRELYFNVFCVNNVIKFDFFHKTFHLSIKTIIGKNTDDLDFIGDQMASLSICSELKNDFYIVNQQTIFEIENKNEDAINNEEIIENKIDMIGGLDAVISEIKDSMNLALGYTKALSGLKISRGMLLHGPPGCGKSILCDAISSQSGALEIKFNAAEIFSKYYGETEINLSQYFKKAFDNYPQPSVIIIEDINSICPKAENSDSVKRISASLMSHFDNLHSKRNGSRVFVIATTSNPDILNPSVRRSGRLDYEVEIPVPSPNQRKEILMKHLSKITNSLTADEISEISTITHGFVGADLISLLSKAMINAMKRPQHSANNTLGVQFCDVQLALGFVKPSAMREVLIENPNIRWTDIGGQHDLKLKLKQAIEWPITHPEVFERLGIKPPRGVLMFGPPGCSKTMIAKALATESKVNFLSIKGSELFSMWVGESERAVRDLFRKARQVAPAIIFFDEIDAIGSERSSDSGSSVKERVLAQMLTEMDGVNTLNHVTIVAATNRPDLIDKALMRPGRIDRIVYVKLPDDETRLEIFRIKTAKMPIEASVNLDDLVKATNGFSGAEVQAVCHEAALKALEESFDATIVTWKHFQYALQIVRPRTSKDLLELYEKYVQEF